MPIISGIEQPFDSTQGVKRPTKLQDPTAAPPVGPDTEGESNPGVICPTSTVIGVFGPWVEFFASTGFRATMLTIDINQINSLQVKNGEIQIGVGAIGFEVEQFGNIMYNSDYSGFADNCAGASYTIPCDIAAGSRVSARFRQVDAGTVDGVCLGITLLSEP